MQVFRLLAPPEGTADVVVDNEGSQDNKAAIGVLSFFGVDQTSPTGSVVSATGQSDSSSVSVSSEIRFPSMISTRCFSLKMAGTTETQS